MSVPQSPTIVMTKVLVFPSCTEPAYEAIDALRMHPRIEVHAAQSLDPENDPSGALLKHHHHLPMLGAPNFEPALRELVVSEGINIIIPCADVVVHALAAMDLGKTQVLAPRPELAEMALSKMATWAAVPEHIPTPKVYDGGAHPSDALPLYAKPDKGAGSRGHLHIDSSAALALAREHDLIVHEHLGGDEFTVDCLSDRRGELLFHQVRQRRVVGRGIALSSQVVEDNLLSQHVKDIAQSLKIEGIWFAQFKRDDAGVAKLMEINTRIGGSMGLARLRGVNIVLAAVFNLQGFEITPPSPLNAAPLRRRLQSFGAIEDYDAVIWDLDDTLTYSDGSIISESAMWLFELRNLEKRQFLVSRNSDPEAVVRTTQLPNYFEEIHRCEDKVPVVRELLERHELQPSRTLMLNDSVTEILRFQAELPDLRHLTPGALSMLARAKR